MPSARERERERERERVRRWSGVREREWTYFGGNHVRRGAVMCMNQVGELAFEAGINASTKRKDLAAKHAWKIRPIFRECIVGGACLATVERAVGEG